MSVFKISACTAVTSLLLIAVGVLPIGAQGRSNGRGQGPKTTPVQTGKPSTPPPGQTKNPSPHPATGTGAPAHAPGAITVKPGLAANLQPLLPGTSINTAAAGFKNLGQFVAAVHVARNLDIPFTALKTEMVTNGHSLGQSIQILKPIADVKVQVTRAEKAAKDDINKYGR